MKIIGYITTFIISMVLAAIWRGYVFSVVWGWFFVTTFSAPELTVAHAIGVSFTIGMLTHQTQDAKNKDKSPADQIGEAFGVAVLTPALVLLIGYIVHLFC